MQHDILKIAVLLIAALALGFAVGYPMLALSICALGIIAWQIYRFDLILRWIKNPNKHPIPETSGQIYLLHRELSRRIKKNRKRKLQLTNYVQQFRQAISAIPDAIVLIDKDENITWANRNANRLLNIRWPNDAGVRFSNLIRDPQVEKLLAETIPSNAQPFDKKQVQTRVIEIPSPKDFNLTLSIKAIDYNATTRMLMVRDVSRLLRVNRMHSDFVANVSHEIKTPLTVLRGYLEILQGRSDLDESLSKALMQMSTQSERMHLLIDDLLYLSQLEDDQHLTKHQPIDVTHLVNTILESVQPNIAKKAHKLQLDIDYGLKIIGNNNELHSAFSNLIINAVTYTQTNGVITVRWQENENGSATFSVIDNGTGIPAKDIPRLTERFYRIDDDRSRESGGTGLGLAIVNHVLQRHSAELDIDSIDGKGSSFHCTFNKQHVLREAVGAERDRRA